ncbi:MAG: SDR family oxidoreductase [Brumimicrobium sp.]|nr:SDR family oxidoreductase [Brumimicrobium sp.]
MKKHLIVGGSGGIGQEIINNLPKEDKIINFGRSELKTDRSEIDHRKLDVLNDELPDLEGLNSIIYLPGTINLNTIYNLKEEDFLTDFKVNVLGAVRVIKKYHRDLKKNGGSIVLFSTVAVKVGLPFHSSVSAAKAAVEGLAKSLAAELAPDVRVNCIAPTVTDTPLASKILKNEKSQKSTEERHPLKRYLEPKEVANLAVYLTGDHAKGMTGQIIGLDAGLGSLRS